MKPRCHGAKTPGHFTSFECVLDEGHDGFCLPYVAPAVDAWRVMTRRMDILRGLVNDLCSDGMGDAGRAVADGALLQAELDAAFGHDPIYGFPAMSPADAVSKAVHAYSCTARVANELAADVARLQSELDALRAIIESANYACAHAAPKHLVSQEATLAEMRGAMDDDDRGANGADPARSARVMNIADGRIPRWIVECSCGVRDENPGGIQDEYDWACPSCGAEFEVSQFHPPSVLPRSACDAKRAAVKQLAAEFNAKHPVGSRVWYWPAGKSWAPNECTIIRPAFADGTRHRVAVVWLSDCGWERFARLDEIEPMDRASDDEPGKATP